MGVELGCDVRFGVLKKRVRNQKEGAINRTANKWDAVDKRSGQK